MVSRPIACAADPAAARAATDRGTRIVYKPIPGLPASLRMHVVDEVQLVNEIAFSFWKQTA